jgi:hypothetical protein
MNIQFLIDLVNRYPEWQDDLDETTCPTGLVSCPICDGGGYIKNPKHKDGCPRKEFEEWKNDKVRLDAESR